MFHFIRLTLLSCCFVAALSACQGEPVTNRVALDDSIPQQHLTAGDIALINGRIYTQNELQQWAEAVVVKQGRIVFVGATDAAHDYYDNDTQIVDLMGKMVLPGIHDTHMHPLEAGSSQVTCILSDQQSLPQLLDTISLCEKPIAPDEWLLGWGHSLETLMDSATDPRQLLDTIDNQRPIAIMEATSHSVWVNSKALTLAGITSDTANPTGGIIVHNAQGQANGILLDGAGDLVFDLAFKPTPERLESHYQGLLWGLQQAAKNGITSLVDARVYWQRGYLQVWQRALQEKQLSARSVLSLWAYPTLADDTQLSQLKSMYSNDPNSLLRVSQIKLYSDGILHNTTAALLQPYEQYLEEIGPQGLNYFSKARLSQYVTELERVGFDMHIHAIGDRGVRESLDAIATAKSINGLDSRHKITHVEMVSEQDKPRFAELRVIADFQVAGDFTKPENQHFMAPLIGDRAYQMLPLADLYASGATVTLSSDWDVSALSPFVGMENALTRGNQSLPNLAAVIGAYTINGAYAMRQEQLTGSIEVGKFGDLVVINQNLFDIAVHDISNTQVIMTILGGKVIYPHNSLD